MKVPALDRYNGCEACDYMGYMEINGRRHRCDCIPRREARERFSEELMLKSNISLYKDMTFERYLAQNKTQRHALRAVLNLHAGFYVFGSYGVGKTHLLAALVHEHRRRHLPAALFTIGQILRMLGDHSQAGKVVHGQLLSVPCLVVDDLGTESLSGYVKERLYDFIDRRYRLAQSGDGHTSFTSQLMHDQLGERYDGRVVSRIRAMTLAMVITGPSQRPPLGRVKFYEPEGAGK